MEILEKILVPIDVNTDTTNQVNRAIELAKHFDSQILLINTVPDTDLKPEIKTMVEKFVRHSLSEIKKRMEENGITVVDSSITFGNVVESIINKAHSEKVNLVLISENKEHERTHYKLSGKSEQIMRASDIPVWLISNTSTTMPSSILCPVDFSEPSERALKNAVRLARKFDSKLTILNVYEAIESVSIRLEADFSGENERRFQKAKEKLQSFVAKFDLSEINHTFEVKSGKAHKNILDTINQENVDMLIMGTNGRTGLSSYIMGNITEKVTREIPCSFMTVKKINAIGVSKASYD